MVEQQTHNLSAGGSNPSVPIKKRKNKKMKEFIKERARNLEEIYTNAIKEIIEEKELKQDASHWIYWHGSDLTRNATKLKIVRNLLETSDEMVPKFINEIKRDILDGYIIKHTTNHLSNAVSIYEYEAMCEIYRELKQFI